MLLECALHLRHLKAHEEEFLFSIADWHGALTPRQMNRLRGICTQLRLIKSAPARPTARPLPRRAIKGLDPRDPHDQLAGVDFDDPPWA
jgi:hypothetical protein